MSRKNALVIVLVIIAVVVIAKTITYFSRLHTVRTYLPQVKESVGQLAHLQTTTPEFTTNHNQLVAGIEHVGPDLYTVITTNTSKLVTTHAAIQKLPYPYGDIESYLGYICYTDSVVIVRLKYNFPSYNPLSIVSKRNSHSQPLRILGFLTKQNAAECGEGGK